MGLVEGAGDAFRGMSVCVCVRMCVCVCSGGLSHVAAKMQRKGGFLSGNGLSNVLGPLAYLAVSSATPYRSFSTPGLPDEDSCAHDVGGEQTESEFDEAA